MQRFSSYSETMTRSSWAWETTGPCVMRTEYFGRENLVFNMHFVLSNEQPEGFLVRSGPRRGEPCNY